MSWYMVTVIFIRSSLNQVKLALFDVDDRFVNSYPTVANARLALDDTGRRITFGIYQSTLL